MTDTLAERIREIREREAKATKGPWHRGDVEGFTDDCVYRADGCNICKALLPEDKAENLTFIAHSRADIPYLFEQLEKALSELMAARKEEREQCCKDVCHRCRCSELQMGPAQIINGEWVHMRDGNKFECLAASIRNRE